MPRNSNRNSNRSKIAVNTHPVSVKPFHPPVSQPSPSFGQIIKDGLGFGIGQSIAHHAVSTVLAPVTTHMQQVQPEAKKTCASEREAFDRCLKINEIFNCPNELHAYKQCIDDLST